MMIELHVLGSDNPIAFNYTNISTVGKSWTKASGAFIRTVDGGVVEVAESYEYILERIPHE